MALRVGQAVTANWRQLRTKLSELCASTLLWEPAARLRQPKVGFLPTDRLVSLRAKRVPSFASYRTFCVFD